MKIAFETHVSDNYFEPVGTRKLINSIKHFYPEMHFYVFSSEAIFMSFDSPHVTWLTLAAHFCKQLADQYDLVVHIDADSVIVGELDELLLGDYDIAGVRNNNDYGMAGCSGPFLRDRPPVNPNIGINDFLNAGLVASTKLGFWTEWDYLNSVHAKYYGTGEQVILNDIAYSGRYKLKVLDPIDSNVYYGTSQLSGILSHWDSWKNVKLVDNKLMLNNKQIKVLHHAGGSKFPKLQFQELFTKEVADWLTTITS